MFGISAVSQQLVFVSFYIFYKILSCNVMTVIFLSNAMLVGVDHRKNKLYYGKD